MKKQFKHQWFTLIGAASVALTSLVGCAKDPYDPQTWIAQLDDSVASEQAVTELKQLGCPEAIKPLGDAWKKYNKSSKILRVIIELADQPDAKAGADQDCPDAAAGPYWSDALEVLKQSVDEFDPGDKREIEDAIVSALALGKSGDDTAVQALIGAATKTEVNKRKIPQNSEAQRVRIAAVRALGSFGSNARAVDTLTKVLDTDPNEQPIQLNAAAANALAETRSEKAIPHLLGALFEISPIYQQVRTALSRVGSKAVPDLLAVFNGTNAEVNAIAKKHDFAKKAPGNLRFKSAALLGDLRAEQAIGPLTAALKTPAKISFFDPRTGAEGPADHNAILDALRSLVASSSADEVYEYMKAEGTTTATRPLAIDVYSMIAKDTKALGWLGDNFSDGSKDEGLRSASALAYARLVASKSELGPVQNVIDKQLKAAAGQDAKAKKAKDDEAKSEAEGAANDYRGFARNYEQHKTRAMVGVQCGAKIECYSDFLTLSGEEIVKKLGIANHRDGDMKKQDMATYRIAALERALLEIAKRGKAGQGIHTKLLEHVSSTERIIRQGVLLALTKTAPKPCAECIARLDEVIAEQEGQTTLDYLTADTKIVRNYFLSAQK